MKDKERQGEMTLREQITHNRHMTTLYRTFHKKIDINTDRKAHRDRESMRPGISVLSNSGMSTNKDPLAPE